MKRFIACVLFLLLGMACGVSVAAERASNDPNAKFTNGVFELPELKSAQQYYVIVVEEADEAQKREPIVLPRGVTAIRLSAIAQPKGRWTWRYELAPEIFQRISLLEPAIGMVPLGELRGEKADEIMFRWRAQPEVASYRLTYWVTTPSLWPAGDEPPAKPATVDIDAKAQHQDTGQADFNAAMIKLPPGAIVRWKVEGFGSTGIKVAESDDVKSTLATPWYAALKRNGLSLQRADQLLSPDKAAQPATFGYARSSVEATAGAARDYSSVYQTEFALLWNGTPFVTKPFGLDAVPRASVEARLHSSGADKATDAVRARAGVTLIGDSSEIVANVKYESDGKLDTKKGLLELAITPTGSIFGLPWPSADGASRDMFGNVPLRALPPATIAITPTAGLELGKTFEVGTSTETKDSIVRYFGIVRADVELNSLALALLLPRVSAFGQVIYRYLPNADGDQSPVFTTAGLDFYVTSNVAISFRYGIGRDAPNFLWARNASVNLGLQF